MTVWLLTPEQDPTGGRVAPLPIWTIWRREELLDSPGSRTTCVAYPTRTDRATSTSILVHKSHLFLSAVFPSASGCKMDTAGSSKALLFTKIRGITSENPSPQYSRPWAHQKWNVINFGNSDGRKAVGVSRLLCVALRGNRMDRQTLPTYWMYYLTFRAYW
jgi:hypothetical protein